MIKKETINGRIFVAKTTFYMYHDEVACRADEASFITRNEDEFEVFKSKHKQKPLHE